MLLRLIFTTILGLLSLNLFAYNEQSFATSLGLELISEGHPFNYLGINTIYANDTLSRQMLVVSSVPGKLSQNRIFKKKDFLILEIPIDSDSYTSIALVGISEQEIHDNIKTTSVWKTLLRELNPLPSARASECSTFGLQATDGLEQLSKHYGSSVAKGAATCISSFLQGIWDSTGGAVGDAYEGLKNLVKDPEAFWDRKVEQFKNIKHFILNFESKMNELMINISALPAETKTMLICNFVGGIGTGVALSILSGGAGLTGVLLKVENYVSKIVKLEKVFSLLNRLGKLTSVPSRFFKRLASGDISDKTLGQLDLFARHNLPEVIQGSMQCAL